MAKRNQMLDDAGHILLNRDHQMKPTTLQNYTAELAMTSELSLTQSSIVKTNTRFAAEHSVRGAVSNVMLIAHSDGISIPDELTAAAWCDGDLPQVHAIVGNHNLFMETKVAANKQNGQELE